MPIEPLVPWDSGNVYLYAPAYEDYENGVISETPSDVLIDPDTNSFWETAGDGVSPIGRVFVGGLFQDDVRPQIPAGAAVLWVGGDITAWWGIEGPSTDPGPVAVWAKIGVTVVRNAVRLQQPLSPSTSAPATLNEWRTYRLTPYVTPSGHTTPIDGWEMVWIDIGTQYSPRPVAPDGTAGPGPWVRFSFLRGELMWVGAPFASITSPGATVATSSPTAEWSYGPGVDGGPQAAYRVIAGPSSTYDGTPWAVIGAEMDTGVVYSSEPSAIIPGVMRAGVEYRVEVHVAQFTNGTLHWNPEPAVVLTTATVSPPDDPIVSTFIDPDPQYASAIALNIDVGGDRAADEVIIERSGDGMNWHPAPFTAGINAIVPGASIVGYRDWETLGNSIETWYRVRTARLTGEDRASTDWVVVGPVAWSSPLVFLKVPGRPWMIHGFELMDGSLETVDTPQDRAMFEVLGRRNPVIVNGGRKGRRSVLYVGIGDDDPDPDATRAGLDAIVEYDPVVVQAPDGYGGWGNLPVSIGAVSERRPIPRIDRPQRVFTLPVTEVDPRGVTTIVPEGPYLSFPAYWVVS